MLPSLAPTASSSARLPDPRDMLSTEVACFAHQSVRTAVMAAESDLDEEPIDVAGWKVPEVASYPIYIALFI